MEFFNINNVFILPYIAIIKKTEFEEKFFSPFQSRGKMSYSFQIQPLPHVKSTLKTLVSQPFLFPLSTKKEYLQASLPESRNTTQFCVEHPVQKLSLILLNVDSIVKTYRLIITSGTKNFCVTPCIKAEILTLNKNVLRKKLYTYNKSNFNTARAKLMINVT